jgi:spore maturation protein CgeB
VNTTANDLGVLLVDASPQGYNSNVRLLDGVAHALGQRLGRERVHRAPLWLAPEQIAEVERGFVLLFGSALPDDCDYGPLWAAARTRNLPLAFWTTEDPYEFDAAYKFVDLADLVLTNDKWTAFHYRFYRNAGVHHLPLAACYERHRRTIPNVEADYAHDVFFCGVGFENRQRVVDGLRPILSKVDTLICGSGWDENEPYIQNRTLTETELLDAYQHSRIVLNLGRSHGYANERFCITPSTPGPRTFEAAMAGTVQLAFADRPEIGDYFTPGEEILLFDGLSDATAHIESILKSPEQRMSIAEAAQRRAIAEHQYVHRIDVILERVSGLLDSPEPSS